MEQVSPNHQLVFAVIDAAAAVEQRLDGALSNIKGISYSEYRLLRTIAESPSGSGTRVELAHGVRLSPSGVTRALKPLKRLGFVKTVRSERDARQARASLTEAGRELYHDATGGINDHIVRVMGGQSMSGSEKVSIARALRTL
jgi:DNA-binding MarR family transcriptional regulator